MIMFKERFDTEDTRKEDEIEISGIVSGEEDKYD